MGINKIIFGTDTLIDLTSDTISPEVILEGYTAHDNSGATITGSLTLPVYEEPYAYDYLKGYTNSGTWKYENSTNNHTDFYTVQNGHSYYLGLGNTVGTRFRAAVLPTNPYGSTSDIAGTQVINTNSPQPRASVVFKANIDGYLCITKDNAYTAGLKSYLIDVTPND